MCEKKVILKNECVRGHEKREKVNQFFFTVKEALLPHEGPSCFIVPAQGTCAFCRQHAGSRLFIQSAFLQEALPPRGPALLLLLVLALATGQFEGDWDVPTKSRQTCDTSVAEGQSQTHSIRLSPYKTRGSQGFAVTAAADGTGRALRAGGSMAETLSSQS